MKRSYLFSMLALIILLSLPFIWAAAEEIPVFLPKEETLPNGEQLEIIPELQPLIDTVQPVLVKLSLLVGGIFGIYLLMFLARVHYERKQTKLLQDIRYNLDRLNQHYGLSSSETKPTLWKKFLALFKRTESKKKK